MTYKGHVKNGVIVLDEPADLPDGTEVEVHPVREGSADASDRRARHTLYDTLKPFIGKVDGMPPDSAINHDHYLYGAPKRDE